MLKLPQRFLSSYMKRNMKFPIAFFNNLLLLLLHLRDFAREIIRSEWCNRATNKTEAMLRYILIFVESFWIFQITFWTQFWKISILTSSFSESLSSFKAWLIFMLMTSNFYSIYQFFSNKSHWKDIPGRFLIVFLHSIVPCFFKFLRYNFKKKRREKFSICERLK